MVGTECSAQTFLDRLNWKVNTGDMEDIIEFQVDVCRFVFNRPLVGEDLRGFTEFVQNLSMSQVRSMMMIWVWLYQHGADFKLKFGINPKLSLMYNIKHIFLPRSIEKELLACGHDDLMRCPVDELKEQYRIRR